MRKLPTKVEGAQFRYDEFLLTCKSTGKTFNSVPTLAWYHSNGDQAFRSVNGVITFIEPSKTSTKQTHKLPKVEPDTIRKYELRVIEEDYVFELAWSIADKRYPEMNKKLDTFGMIVNSIVTRLLTI